MRNDQVVEAQWHEIAPMFLRLKDIPRVTNLSLSTISRLRKMNCLPQPDARFGKALCWRPSTIEAWCEAGGKNR
jgi:predicted DNA-binding transcriptional regulator AlpA